MVEVIISIFIIGLAASVATGMIVMAISANRVSKNRMIATNLAREGIEAVRNIRDSNWLQYSSNKDECWNFWERPDKFTDSGADDYFVKCEAGESQFIGNGKYKVMYGRYDLKNDNDVPYTYKWFLSEPVSSVGSANDIENLDYGNATQLEELKDYQLYFLDILPNDDGKDGDGNNTNDREHFVYTTIGENGADTNEVLAPTVPQLYRQVSVQYLNESDGTDSSSATNIMKVTVKVLWFENGQKRVVELQSILENYFI